MAAERSAAGPIGKGGRKPENYDPKPPNIGADPLNPDFVPPKEGEFDIPSNVSDFIFGKSDKKP